MIELVSEAQIEEIRHSQELCIIFKHSTRCSISSVALNRIRGSLEVLKNKYATIYYLDIIRHRNISNLIAEIYDVQHESPQVLVVRGESCLLDLSHLEIRSDELMAL